MPLYKTGIIDYTWATKPSVAPSGQIICITDIGENGSLWRGNGTKWVRINCIRYYDATATVEVTGTTDEVTMLTIPVKGGLVGASGKMILYPMFTITNNANNKVLRVKMNSTIVHAYNAISVPNNVAIIIVRNFNNEAVQKTGLSSSISALVANGASSILETTVDTSVDFNLVLTVSLANAADRVKLESLFVEIF